MAGDLTVGTVISLTLTSSVVGAIITQAAVWFREGRNGKREVAYLALRLATTFERFAEDAAGVTGAVNDFATGHREGVGTELPQLQPLPDEKERWRDLDVDLTAQVLGFAELIRSKQGSIGNLWDVSSPEDGIDAAKRSAVVLGVRAIRLAGSLRRRYRLPVFDTPSPWADFLSAEYDELPASSRDDVPTA